MTWTRAFRLRLVPCIAHAPLDVVDYGLFGLLDAGGLHVPLPVGPAQRYNALLTYCQRRVKDAVTLVKDNKAASEDLRPLFDEALRNVTKTLNARYGVRRSVRGITVIPPDSRSLSNRRTRSAYERRQVIRSVI